MIVKRDQHSITSGRSRSGFDWLPENIAQYFNDQYCTISISVCNTDVENGYGVRISKAFQVLRPYKKCRRCGYHTLWNPDDRDSRCQRHNYERGWDAVFSYTLDTGERKISLEDAFSRFIEAQPDRDFLPVKALHF